MSIAKETPYEMRVSRGFHKVKTLAEASGVRAERIRKYERGELRRESNEAHEAFEKIAAALGVTKVTYMVAVRTMSKPAVKYKYRANGWNVERVELDKNGYADNETRTAILSCYCESNTKGAVPIADHEAERLAQKIAGFLNLA